MSRCRIFSIFIFLITLVSCTNHRFYSEYKEKEIVKSKNEIILISSSGCGYCLLAKKHLIKLSNDDTKLIIVEENPKPYDSLLVIDASNFASFNYKFFPQIIVRTGNKKVSYRGWDKSIFKRIENQLKK